MTAAETTTPPPSRLPERLHHHADAVKDHEANRRFFEDTLGIPLVATWCEMTHHPQFGRPVAMCHTFFEWPTGAPWRSSSSPTPKFTNSASPSIRRSIPNFDHIAFKVEPETYDEIITRLQRAGEAFRETDHGYCKSADATSPDG